MVNYRVFTTDLRTNNLLADLPMTGISVEEELSDAGSMSGSINMFEAIDRAALIKTATVPARTAIWVSTGGQLLWGGIIWKRRLRAHVLEINASGFLSYFAQSRISADLTFDGVDQFQIARALFNHGLGKTGGDIGVVMDSATSGVERDRTYLAEDHKPIADAVKELAAVIDGFDLAIRAEYDSGGVPRKVLRMGYPWLGVSAADTGLLIEYPGNITDWEWPEEGDRMITTAYVRGEAPAVEPPVVDPNADPNAPVPDTPPDPPIPFGIYTDNSLLEQGYPRLEQEFSAASGTVRQSTLDAAAVGAVRTYGRPIVLPAFTVAAGSDLSPPHVSDFTVGDWLRVRLTDPQWLPEGPTGRPGFDGYMRVIKRTISLGGGEGGESMALTMNPLQVQGV